MHVQIFHCAQWLNLCFRPILMRHSSPSICTLSVHTSSAMVKLQSMTSLVNVLTARSRAKFSPRMSKVRATFKQVSKYFSIKHISHRVIHYYALVACAFLDTFVIHVRLCCFLLLFLLRVSADHVVLAALTVQFPMSDGSHKEEEIDSRRKRRRRAGRRSKNNIEERNEIWRPETTHKRVAHQTGGQDRDTVKQTNRQINCAVSIQTDSDEKWSLRRYDQLKMGAFRLWHCRLITHKGWN